ncbi:MAG: nucleoside phosphorylase [Crocinitomicaceae bacterium]|nr:nucleoside phosphorylase [Crocinitomicaceae bacterium]
MQYPSSELVLDKKGQVYHLGILPENLAKHVILVGDQDRVAMISAFFDEIEHQSHHREFVCHTGTYKGKRISVISTGIGTDNIDIVVNELDALVNIDLKNRCNLETQTSLNLVRIGTCGILQADIPIHSYILSSHACGLDNVAHFYDVTYSDDETVLLAEMNAHLQLPPKIQPYVVSANEDLVQKLSSNQTFEGITVTSSGFYGPQGRTLRLGLSTIDLNEKLTSFRESDSSRNLRVMNFEMESSSLFVLGKNLGHACTTICLGIANRPNLEFSKGYDAEMNGLIEYVLKRI